MPCDSITTQSVVLKNAMPAIVEKALAALGWKDIRSTANSILARCDSYTLEWKKGVGITVEGRRTTDATINNLTREYSKQAVSWAASRAGWQVKDTGQNTLAVTRR